MRLANIEQEMRTYAVTKGGSMRFISPQSERFSLLGK
jgi:hypothetical protein